MKTIKVLAFIFALGTVAMSCSKSSTPAAVNATDAAAAANNSNTQLTTDITAAQNTPGALALNSFSSLTGGTPLSPFGRITSFKPKDISASLKKGLVGIHAMLVNVTSGAKPGARVNGSDPFDYNSKKGVYEYNFGTYQFDKTGSSSIIEIKYPSDGSSTNNADFQLTGYTETDLGGYYSATLIQATVTVDGTKEAEIKYSASYNSTTESLNLESLYLFLNPYTFTLNFDDRSSTGTSEGFTLSKSGTTLIDVLISLSYNTNFPKDSGVPSAISGHIQLMTVRFTGSVDVAGASQSQSGDPNDFVHISMTVNGGAAGKIYFESDGNGGYVTDIMYNDGSKASFDTVFADLESQLGDFGI